MENDFLSRGYGCPDLLAELTITSFTDLNLNTAEVPTNIEDFFYIDKDNIVAEVAYGALEYGLYVGTLEFYYDGVLNAAGL